MKLIIKRDQKAQTGFLGGHKGMTFLLSYRVELTPEEKDLVAKYKVEDKLLAFTSEKGEDIKYIQKYTTGSLMRGGAEEVKDITILLDHEEVIKHACKNFKTLLDVMATFGGEEVIEF